MVRLLLIFTLSISLSSNSLGKEDEKLDGLFDKNQDGVTDVFYEYSEDGSYIELVDSNYDKKIDERCAYDSNDTLVNCTYDQDFDGHEETRVEYEVGVLSKEGVDANNDQFFEIIFHYKSGVLFEGFKYYHDRNGKKMIGNVRFEFGYPTSEKFVETDLSERDFSNSYWLKD